MDASVAAEIAHTLRDIRSHLEWQSELMYQDHSHKAYPPDPPPREHSEDRQGRIMDEVLDRDKKKK